jgi:UDP-glucuronate 4-epimerase
MDHAITFEDVTDWAAGLEALYARIAPRFVEILERETGREAIKRFVDLQAGDVLATYPHVDDLEEAVGFRPRTSIEDGLARFVAWYREFYGF